MPSSSRNIRFSNPAQLPAPLGYSHIVETTGGRTIYLSGQVPLDADRQLVGTNDMESQATQVFENIVVALTSVGASCADIVKLTFFLTDIWQIAAVRRVRDRYINVSQPPASSAVEVRRLVHDAFLIEIEAIAIVEEG